IHWVDSQNWDTNAQPDATSDVRIAAGFTVEHDSGSEAIQSLSSDGNLQFTGMLTLTAFSTVNGQFTFGGTLYLGATLELHGGGSLTGLVEGTLLEGGGGGQNGPSGGGGGMEGSSSSGPKLLFAEGEYSVQDLTAQDLEVDVAGPATVSTAGTVSAD